MIKIEHTKMKLELPPTGEQESSNLECLYSDKVQLLCWTWSSKLCVIEHILDKGGMLLKRSWFIMLGLETTKWEIPFINTCIIYKEYAITNCSTIVNDTLQASVLNYKIMMTQNLLVSNIDILLRKQSRELLGKHFRMQ